jgi:hypothetical protein
MSIAVRAPTANARVVSVPAVEAVESSVAVEVIVTRITVDLVVSDSPVHDVVAFISDDNVVVRAAEYPIATGAAFQKLIQEPLVATTAGDAIRTRPSENVVSSSSSSEAVCPALPRDEVLSAISEDDVAVGTSLDLLDPNDRVLSLPACGVVREVHADRLTRMGIRDEVIVVWASSIDSVATGSRREELIAKTPR